MSNVNPDATDPLSAWRALYESNREVWARGMSEMLNTEAFSQAFGAYLDNYLASSAHFRKMIEQYMEFWLANFNMPSRDEINRLARQVADIEARLDNIGAFAAKSMGADTTDESQASAFQERVQELETRIQSLDAKTDQIMQLLQERLTEGTEKQGTDARGDIEIRVQSLDDKAGQLLELIQSLQTVPNN